MTMNRDQCLLCKSCIYFSGHIAKACTTHIRAPNANPQFCNKWVLKVYRILIFWAVWAADAFLEWGLRWEISGF